MQRAGERLGVGVITVNGRGCKQGRYLESLHHTIASSDVRTNNVTMALSIADFQKCGRAGDGRVANGAAGCNCHAPVHASTVVSLPVPRRGKKMPRPRRVSRAKQSLPQLFPSYPPIPSTRPQTLRVIWCIQRHTPSSGVSPYSVLLHAVQTLPGMQGTRRRIVLE